MAYGGSDEFNMGAPSDYPTDISRTFSEVSKFFVRLLSSYKHFTPS